MSIRASSSGSDRHCVSRRPHSKKRSRPRGTSATSTSASLSRSSSSSSSRRSGRSRAPRRASGRRQHPPHIARQLLAYDRLEHAHVGGDPRGDPLAELVILELERQRLPQSCPAAIPLLDQHVLPEPALDLLAAPAECAEQARVGEV